jgi:hypothetical protein
MTSEGLGEMFKGDSADMCAGTFPLVLMGGRVEGLAYADPGARTPIGASGNFVILQDGMFIVVCMSKAIPAAPSILIKNEDRKIVHNDAI